MGQTPPRILTHRDDLDALERWIVALDDEALVRVSLASGARLDGIVSARPTIEVFRDADGREGHNARLRLDDRAVPDVPHYLWLSDIVDIERLPDARVP